MGPKKFFFRGNIIYPSDCRKANTNKWKKTVDLFYFIDSYWTLDHRFFFLSFFFKEIRPQMITT